MPRNDSGMAGVHSFSDNILDNLEDEPIYSDDADKFLQVDESGDMPNLKNHRKGNGEKKVISSKDMVNPPESALSQQISKKASNQTKKTREKRLLFNKGRNSEGA